MRSTDRLRFMPFFLCVAASLLTFAFPPYYGGKLGMLGVAVLAALVVGVLWFVHFRRHSELLRIATIAMTLFGLFAFQYATGGSSSGARPLLIVPALWAAVYGSRRALWATALGALLIGFLPIFVVGSPSWGWQSWRAAAIWVIVIAVLLPAVHEVVARLEAQQAAERETSAQLQAVLRAATNHVILVTDDRGVVTTFNDGAQRILGYDRGDVVGTLTPDVFFEPGQLAEAAAEYGVADSYAAVIAAAVRERHWTRDWIWLRSDGSPLVVRLSVTAMADGDGYLGIAFEVTREVEVGEKLRQAEARWRTLLDSMPDTTVLVIDDELRYQLATGGGLGRFADVDLTGRSVGEVLDGHTRDVVDAAFRTAFSAAADTALETGNEPQQVATVDVNVGAESFRLAVTRLPDRHGQREALVVAQNVTTDRRREHALAQAEERFRRIFAESPNGTALIDTEGRFIQVNPALCAILGRSEDELRGHLVGDVGLLDDAEVQARFAALLYGIHDREESEWVVDRGDDHSIHLSVSSVILRDADGDPESVLMNIVDISQRRRLEKHLAHLADHDPLTGLANRRRFDQELAGHLERCRRYGASGALMMFDLDHFKQINDTLGHGAGDDLIVATAEALKRRLRTSDVIARLGGDEFAVLLPNVDRGDAVRVAESVVRLIRDEVTVPDGPLDRHVTTSVGLALIEDSGVTATDLVATADLSMYAAKEAGRDRVVLLDAAEQEKLRASSRVAWAERIADALEEQRFTLFAQPMLDLPSGRVVGAELLVRMIDADGSLVPPGRFLYVAERVGLIGRIDSWVAEQATALLHRLDRRAAPAVIRSGRSGDPDRVDYPVDLSEFRLHVNISGESMSDQGFLETLSAISAGLGARSARRLVLEIAETAAVARVDEARAFGQRARELGFSLALDNFGAGFGSVYYLKHLRFDYLKVDGEFVVKSDTNPTDRLILESIVGLANGLGAHTIAENVETSEVLSLVGGEGFEAAQGFRVGPPVPVAEFLSS